MGVEEKHKLRWSVGSRLADSLTVGKLGNHRRAFATIPPGRRAALIGTSASFVVRGRWNVN
jgi:hypothetical protein